MSRFTACLLVLICVSAFAQEELKISENAKAYAEASVRFREAKIELLEEQMTAMRKAKASKQQIAAVKETLQKLQKADELPSLIMYCGEMKVGQMGVVMSKATDVALIGNPDITPLFRVINVLGKDSAIVSCEDKFTLILKGIDTTNFVTRRNEYITDEFIVTGTETYENVSGGSTTAFVLEKFTEREAAEAYAKTLKKKKK